MLLRQEDLTGAFTGVAVGVAGEAIAALGNGLLLSRGQHGKEGKSKDELQHFSVGGKMSTKLGLIRHHTMLVPRVKSGVQTFRVADASNKLLQMQLRTELAAVLLSVESFLQ